MNLCDLSRSEFLAGEARGLVRAARAIYPDASDAEIIRALGQMVLIERSRLGAPVDVGIVIRALGGAIMAERDRIEGGEREAQEAAEKAGNGLRAGRDVAAAAAAV